MEDPRAPDVPQDGTVTDRSWLRPAGLFLLALAFGIFEPRVLVGLPYLLLVLVLPGRSLPAVALGAFAALLVFGGTGREGLWYVERGWAIVLGGWFLALTLRWPGAGFTARALGAVAGGGAVVATLFAVRPGAWSVLDWLVRDRMRSGMSGALEALRAVRGEDSPVPERLVESIYQTVEVQAEIYPALVALASVAALGVAWWLWVRFARGEADGLAPIREFRFNDQLVWLFIAGLVPLVTEVGAVWTQVGSNALVFMGALYALRGVAVVVFFNGGVSLLGALVLAMGLLFIAPVILAGALVIGLGDTWLDLRERAREIAA